MTVSLKIIFFLAGLLSFQTIFGQLKFGRYKSVSDTTNWSTLSFSENHTFKYEYRTSLSHYAWYNSDGKWEINKDTLILTDTVITLYPYLDEKVLRMTTFKIEETNLIYLSQRFAREHAYSRRKLVGNYTLDK